jgi:hypothetical protein
VSNSVYSTGVERRVAASKDEEGKNAKTRKRQKRFVIFLLVGGVD